MNIVKPVNDQNPHWKNPELLPPIPKFKRDLFTPLRNALDLRPMTLLTGTRRTGKSVLLRQLQRELLDVRHMPSRQLLFFEFNPSPGNPPVTQVFDYFKNHICDTRQHMYLLFDEVQFVTNYESDLKLIYDLYPQAKMILTGSFSLSYKKKMTESLAGRFLPHRLYPLKFSEYLTLAKPDLLPDMSLTRTASDQFARKGALTRLNAEFRNFLARGRLPELPSLPDAAKSSYLQSVLSQSLNQDVYAYFDIQKPAVLQALFVALRQVNGRLVNYQKLASAAATRAKTISRYLDCLELMGLVYVVYNSTDPLIKLNSAKKTYISSHFFLLDTKYDYDASLGMAVESYVLERLLESGHTVTFYRHRMKEIDFLLPKEGVAYEVKFRARFDVPKNPLPGYELRVVSQTGPTPACLL